MRVLIMYIPKSLNDKFILYKLGIILPGGERPIEKLDYSNLKHRMSFPYLP